MRFVTLTTLLLHAALGLSSSQIPLLHHDEPRDRSVSPHLFAELEELARIVDIAYCVGFTNTGISKPFSCLSRCSQFPDFELVKTWNTGPLMSDSCGYIALDHSVLNPRIIVAFRGTYSIANAVVDLSTVHQDYVPYPGSPDEAKLKKTAAWKSASKADSPKCDNCTVHSGFYQSWRVTSDTIRPELDALVATRPTYKLHLVGHSLGGAVAALAGLDFLSHGWEPIITTYGEPRIGNKGLMTYIDDMFNLNYRPSTTRSQVASLQSYENGLTFRRVTHIDDPVPQLPLSEWGFRMHAGEIYITKSDLTPDVQDMQHCFGDEDPLCIAGQDASLAAFHDKPNSPRVEAVGFPDPRKTVANVVKAAGLWESVGGGVTIPARYKLWQMLFAHRDYFWRLGLCVPSGNPWNWGREPGPAIEHDEVGRIELVE